MESTISRAASVVKGAVLVDGGDVTADNIRRHKGGSPSGEAFLISAGEGAAEVDAFDE